MVNLIRSQSRYASHPRQSVVSSSLTYAIIAYIYSYKLLSASHVLHSLTYIHLSTIKIIHDSLKAREVLVVS
jgi:hypothetical protein